MKGILLTFIFLLCWKGYHASVTAIGVTQSVFIPCNNWAVSMKHKTGQPPSLDNYWDGTVYPREVSQSFTQYTIEMVLQAPASIFVDEDEATASFLENMFQINYFDLPNRTELNFKVQGKKDKLFPDIASIRLNGVDICPNPRQWRKLPSSVENIVDSTNQNRFDMYSCGRQVIKHSALIMNGFPSQEGEWPWHVAIYHRNLNNLLEYKCGGTILSNDTVLTAAHCVTAGSINIPPDKIFVRLGQHDRFATSEHTRELAVFRVLVHDEYDDMDLNHDIALLRLASQTVFTSYIQPACLWDSEESNLEEVIGQNGVVVGWGLNEHEQSSTVLSQARMPVVDFGVCLESNRDVFGTLLSQTNYCAGFRNGTSVCNGDSGGGMFFQKNGRYYIRGLVSVSTTQENREICDPKQYVIFTDVAKYVHWIRRNFS